MSSNYHKDNSKSYDMYSNYGGISPANGPRYGTTIPNRIFVGGLPTDVRALFSIFEESKVYPIFDILAIQANEAELKSLFSTFGTVTGVKIIIDRAGAPKGYGFVTFESEEEAKRTLKESDNLTLRGRKLNMAMAVKKQSYLPCIGNSMHRSQASKLVNGLDFESDSGLLLMANRGFLYPHGALIPQYNEAPQYVLDAGYPMVPNTCPLLYQPPIYVAPNAAPFAPYPLHASYQPYAPYQNVYLTSNGPASWRLSNPNDCIPYVNTLVNLNK